MLLKLLGVSVCFAPKKVSYCPLTTWSQLQSFLPHPLHDLRENINKYFDTIAGPSICSLGRGQEVEAQLWRGSAGWER